MGGFEAGFFLACSGSRRGCGVVGCLGDSRGAFATVSARAGLSDVCDGGLTGMMTLTLMSFKGDFPLGPLGDGLLLNGTQSST